MELFQLIWHLPLQQPVDLIYAVLVDVVLLNNQRLERYLFVKTMDYE